MNDLETKLDVLVQLVLRARCFFDLWWVYEGAPTRQMHLDAMNQYSEFFRFDTHAQQVAYTIYLCQLFEDKSKTLSISAALRQAKHKGLPPQTIAVVEQLLQKAKPIVKKLIIIRSNLFAHRSLTLDYGTAFTRASITPNQIRCLCEIGLKALNSLRVAIRQNEHEFSALPAEDLGRLLKDIRQTDNE